MPESRLVSRILGVLDEHGPLEHNDIASRLEEPPHVVRDVLSRLRGIGFVAVANAGDLEAHLARPPARWRLTEQGREKLAQLRADGRAPST